MHGIRRLHRSLPSYGKLAVAIALTIGPASLAQAGNLVTNPGFEDSLNGWTTNTSNSNYSWTVSSQNVEFGSFDARNGAGYNCGDTNCLDPTQGAYLYQDLSTVIGDTYTISFEYYFGGNNGLQEIDAYFGGNLDANLTTETNTPEWTLYSFTETATSTTSRLEFTQVNDPDYTYLDNVSVTLASTPAPEPVSWVMMTSGLAAMLLFKNVLSRKRQQRVN